MDHSNLIREPMPIIAPSRRSVVVIVHIGAQLLFGFYLVYMVAFYYIRSDSISKLLPPRFSSIPQWAGNWNVSCPHNPSTMGQKDTTLIELIDVKPVPRAFDSADAFKLNWHYMSMNIYVKDGWSATVGAADASGGNRSLRVWWR
jgi:hypothetical protein